MIRLGEAPQRSEQEQAAEVEHYFWTDTIRAAREMGTDMRSVCGVWDGPPEWVDKIDDKGVAEAIVTAEPETCPACLAALEAEVLDRLA